MLELLKAIPALVILLREIFDFIKEVYGKDPQKLIADAGVAFKALKEAKTSEQKIEAGKKLQDSFSRL